MQEIEALDQQIDLIEGLQKVNEELGEVADLVKLGKSDDAITNHLIERSVKLADEVNKLNGRLDGMTALHGELEKLTKAHNTIRRVTAALEALTTLIVAAARGEDATGQEILESFANYIDATKTAIGLLAPLNPAIAAYLKLMTAAVESAAIAAGRLEARKEEIDSVVREVHDLIVGENYDRDGDGETSAEELQARLDIELNRLLDARIEAQYTKDAVARIKAEHACAEARDHSRGYYQDLRDGIGELDARIAERMMALALHDAMSADERQQILDQIDGYYRERAAAQRELNEYLNCVRRRLAAGVGEDRRTSMGALPVWGWAAAVLVMVLVFAGGFLALSGRGGDEAVASDVDCDAVGVAPEPGQVTIEGDLDPRAQLGHVVPVVSDTGELWLVLCFNEAWAESAPVDLASVYFELGIVPSVGEAAHVLWEWHDGTSRVTGATESAEFRPVFVRLAGGHVAVSTGLDHGTGGFDGFVFFASRAQVWSAETGTGTAEVEQDGWSEVELQLQVSSDELLRGSLETLLSPRAADSTQWPNFSENGLSEGNA